MNVQPLDALAPMTVRDAATGAGGGQRDLILGIVDNYDFYEVSRFLITLRQTSFDGHVCLFAGPNISVRTARRIREHDVEVIQYGPRFPFIESPHPDGPSSLPEPIHIYNYRHFLYYDFLLKHAARFRNVLITDAKDVVFQSDPFDFPLHERLNVAMENPDILIGECPWTSPWVLSGYGPEVLERLKNKEMSCAGTTIAPAAVMMRYLELMLQQIGRMKDAYACADQAAHNLLLHEGALEPTQRLRNFESAILTVGSEPAYRLDAAGELVNRDGSAIAIIHQYDRHKELARLFEAKVRPSGWQRLGAKIAFRVRLLPRRFWAKMGRRR
jgi:hypothetical protein